MIILCYMILKENLLYSSLIGWNNLLMINDLLYEVFDMFRFERDFQKKHEIMKVTT